MTSLGLGTITLHSRADNRDRFLVRPDLGRRIRPEDLSYLPRGTRPDIVFVVSDGLSSAAVQNHALPLLEAVLPAIAGLAKAPIVIARQARVALSDEVGECLGARLAICLIGERPGLSSPDSLGIYITYGPSVRNTDEARNCISNVRPGGLTFADAADLLVRLIRLSLAHGSTGIALQAKAGLLLGGGNRESSAAP
jgi:ethanolamine ammonia-lyase small subunit